MADSFIGEIRILPYNYAPDEWAWCNGQLVPAQQNQALFSVIGALYGGNGTTNFNLPNLMTPTFEPAAAMGVGEGPGLTPRTITPDTLGDVSVTVAVTDMPMHSHGFTAQSTSVVANLIANPANAWLARGIYADATASAFYTYAPENPLGQVAFRGPALSTTGQGGAHENRQPFLVVNFCISLAGTYPLRPN